MFRKKKSSEEKGIEIGQALIEVIPETCNSMLTNLKEQGVHLKTKNARQFALEVYVFYMHILDRMAFAFLGTPERKAFADALTYCIANGFGSVNQLRDTYNKRQVQYANYKEVLPADGQQLKGTLVWEFSKVLFAITGDSNPATLMSLSVMVADISTTLYTSTETAKLLKS